jgi:WhiB family redox-sensing transcriptional regulator
MDDPIGLYQGRPAWLDRAACRGVHPDVFHPPHPSTAVKAVQYAKSICAGCPVKADCLEHFLDQPVGIYGGTTPNERYRLRKARREAVA